MRLLDMYCQISSFRQTAIFAENKNKNVFCLYNVQMVYMLPEAGDVCNYDMLQRDRAVLSLTYQKCKMFPSEDT